jgi:hypothetical protein
VVSFVVVAAVAVVAVAVTDVLWGVLHGLHVVMMCCGVGGGWGGEGGDWGI